MAIHVSSAIHLYTQAVRSSVLLNHHLTSLQVTAMVILVLHPSMCVGMHGCMCAYACSCMHTCTHTCEPYGICADLWVRRYLSVRTLHPRPYTCPCTCLSRCPCACHFPCRCTSVYIHVQAWLHTYFRRALGELWAAKLRWPGRRAIHLDVKSSCHSVTSIRVK